MKSSRPICVHCGKAYGQRDVSLQHVRWPIGQERPPYTGNGIVVKEGYEHQTPGRASFEMMGMTLRNETASLPEQSEMASTRLVWDGQSWTGGYKPFCTMRCALDYARKAYKKEQRR